MAKTNTLLTKFLNSYFGFNKQQRNGLYVLCCVSLLLLLLRLIYPTFIKEDDIHVENLDLIEKDLIFGQESPPDGKIINSNKIQLFVFDPNDVNLENLIKNGFTEKTAKTLIKFRSNGFKFKQKADLKKVFGVSEKLYAQIEPYILIKHDPKPVDEKQNSTTENRKSSSKKLELNEADSLALIDLKGVGPGFAKRILKYRNLLGGFYSVNQVKEIYGMTDELFELITQQCFLNASLLIKFNINTSEFKILNKHPYIKYELAKQIFNFRRHHEITESNLNEAIQNNELVEKLKPYLQY